MMRLRHFLTAALFLYEAALVSCANQTIFGTSAPGYLYNLGSKVFLTWSNTPIERFLWIKGTKEETKAKLFRIQRAKYHSATYNLIMPANPNLNNVFKQKLTPIPSYPFYGMPTMCLVGSQQSQHIGLTLDTSNSNGWFSFSPPVTKDNFFQIYLNNKCLEIEEYGYLKLQECAVFPHDKRKRQLFKWFLEDEYLVYKRHHIRNNKIVKSNPHIIPKQYRPIVDTVKKQRPSSTTPQRTRNLEVFRKLHSRRIGDLPKTYYDNPDSSDGTEDYNGNHAPHYSSPSAQESAHDSKTMPPGF